MQRFVSENEDFYSDIAKRMHELNLPGLLVKILSEKFKSSLPVPNLPPNFAGSRPMPPPKHLDQNNQFPPPHQGPPHQPHRGPPPTPGFNTYPPNHSFPGIPGNPPLLQPQPIISQFPGPPKPHIIQNPPPMHGSSFPDPRFNPQMPPRNGGGEHFNFPYAPPFKHPPNPSYPPYIDPMPSQNINHEMNPNVNGPFEGGPNISNPYLQPQKPYNYNPNIPPPRDGINPNNPYHTQLANYMHNNNRGMINEDLHPHPNFMNQKPPERPNGIPLMDIRPPSVPAPEVRNNFPPKYPPNMVNNPVTPPPWNPGYSQGPPPPKRNDSENNEEGYFSDTNSPARVDEIETQQSPEKPPSLTKLKDSPPSGKKPPNEEPQQLSNEDLQKFNEKMKSFGILSFGDKEEPEPEIKPEDITTKQMKDITAEDLKALDIPSMRNENGPVNDQILKQIKSVLPQVQSQSPDNIKNLVNMYLKLSKDPRLQSKTQS